MKSLLSHLVPHWHLKGTLLAAEDTGKLQALASWLSPFFLPFFFFFLPWQTFVFLSALEKLQNRFVGCYGIPERRRWRGCWWWPLSGQRGIRQGL